MTTERTPQVIDAAPGAGAREVLAYTPPAASPFDAEPRAFANLVQQRGENYRNLVSWLIDHMVAGEDVMQVHIAKKDSCQYGGPPPRGQCGPSILPGHWSDPDLSKKGAEKVCGLLGLGTRFLGMEDFRRAALKGIKIEHVIIDCEIYNQHATLSQGTGACSLDETYSNLNSAMKKACKRAHVDAVKRCAGLSGLATELKRRLPPPNLEAAERAAQVAPQGRYSVDSGARWDTGATLECMPFGKNRGKRWRELPTDFLEWVVRSLSDKPDLVRAAAAELSKRKSATGPSSIRTQPSPSPSEDPPDWNENEIPY